jgi:methionine sulfoxide reductase heme-binding subunit
VNPTLADALWYLGRGSGVTALILLTVVLGLGIVVHTRLAPPGMTRLVAVRLHDSAALLAVGFVVVHIVSLLLDPYAQLRLVDLVLPFVNERDPLWVGLGTLALDMIVVVVGTSLARRHMSRRLWRAVHWCAYALWPAAFLHAVGAGTDAATTVWMPLVASGSFVVAATLVMRRTLPAQADRRSKVRGWRGPTLGA